MNVLGILQSGEIVVDRFNSHAHNAVSVLLPEALARIDSQGEGFIEREVDFGRVIGESICVATTASDQIIYAKRPKRFGHSRFVLNRKPEECTSMVVVLKAGDNDQYILITAFIGHLSQPEPWDDRNFEKKADPKKAVFESRKFWSSHALIFGHEEVIPGSETTRCPW